MKRLAFALWLLFTPLAAEASSASSSLAAAHVSLAQSAVEIAMDKLTIGPSDPIGSAYQLDAVRVELSQAWESIEDPAAQQEIRTLRSQASEIAEGIGKRQAKALPTLRKLYDRLDTLRRTLLKNDLIS